MVNLQKLGAVRQKVGGVVIATMGDWVRSSSDPKKVSLTISSAISLILSVAGLFGITGLENDLNELGDAIVRLVASIAVATSSIGVIVGAFRKIKNYFQK